MLFPLDLFGSLGLLVLALSSRSVLSQRRNPILPGFHPDPSCIFLPTWDDTFFCASSSFNAFPGIPIHASQDLQNWKLIGRFFLVNIHDDGASRLLGRKCTLEA